MSQYFPLFMDMSRHSVLFVGGGKIATRRVLALHTFSERITVLAPDISGEILELEKQGRVRCLTKCFEETDLAGATIVCICTPDAALNHRIYESCRARGILVNNCSNQKECDFYFPGIVNKEHVTVGINASGQAHGQVKRLREQIERDIDRLLAE